MSFTVPLALFGWVPLCILLFAWLPARRAVAVGITGAWLFLPMAAYPMGSLPDWDKAMAGSAGVLLAAALFDSDALLRVRFGWFDLPMLVFCICPILSCLSAGLGLYAGMALVMKQVVWWGIPYFLGRVYFSDLAGIRELAITVFVGGLIYAPLCLYEIRMSPQLHRIVYGFHQHEFMQTRRFGGWRPMVFLQHGLAAGMWMCMAAMLGIWLWFSGSVREVGKLPVAWLVLGLTATALLCKSMGAIELLACGAGVLGLAWFWRNPIPLLLVFLVAPAYMVSRTSGAWSGRSLVEMESEVNEERSGSLEYRLDNEDIIIERARSRPLFGYGWGQFMENEDGRTDVVPDGLWTLTLGRFGYVGLVSLTLSLLGPVLLMWWSWPAKFWRHPAVAPAVGLGILLCLHMIDNLMNAMINPVFVMAAGALGGGRVMLPLASQSARKLKIRVAELIPARAAAQ